MALTNGTKLGPYEIVAPLGTGGMGEVYRARDTRLGREVAIKILPSQLTERPESRQRFEREARAVSALNDPHICTLHDIGSQDGTEFLVMEYLEGETLAARLEKGPLPLDQVLKYGVEIAGALDKAHRQAIIHRDLKPGNIMLTKSGAKLLDFGLAKAVPLAAEATGGVTRTTPVTQQGAIVGTFQYMSPEQVEGKEVDARSDIFSFGAVLYEMVTGRRAFPGKSHLSVASAILEKEPTPISDIKPMTPPALDHAVRRCLAKDREERWQTARDLALELQWISESGSQTTRTSSAGGMRRSWTGVVLCGSVSAVLATITGLTAWNLKSIPPRPVSRTVITLPPGQRLAGLDEPAVALSPDGRNLAYVGVQGGTQQLYLRAMDSLEARPIAGTEGAVNPFFSPDGQWLGFFAGQKLRKVAVSGGAAVTLADAMNPHGASWSRLGMIAFAMQVSSLQQMPDEGGTPQPLMRLEGEISHRRPEFLPDGKAVLFAAGAHTFNWADAQVAIQSLGTGERRTLIKRAMHPSYAPSGHLLFVQGGNLMAAPFDADRLAVSGTAAPLVEGILWSPTSGAAQYSISATGSLVYVGGAVKEDQRRLVWVSRSGVEQRVAAPERAYLSPRVSPGGRQAAVAVVTEQETELWLYDLSREMLSRFTFEGNVNNSAVWTPDGQRIVFQSGKEGVANVYWQRADGSGGRERLTTSESANFPGSWSPDGQLLAFAVSILRRDMTSGFCG